MIVLISDYGIFTGAPPLSAIDYWGSEISFTAPKALP